jgi:hypothetical protein
MLSSVLLLALGGVLLTSCVASPVAARDLPPISEYVVPKEDGDLYLNGKRICLWGGIGAFPPRRYAGKDDPYYANRLQMERIKAYGFNHHRIFGYNTAIFNNPQGYTKGDGSRLDVYDHMIWLAKKNGFHLQHGSAGAGGMASVEDVDIIDDPATADAWAAAVKEMTKPRRGFRKQGIFLRHCIAAMWDPRLEAIIIRNNATFLDHVNQHTRLRVGDDPVFAIWELTNEQWWIIKMVSGRWQKLPDFFQESLIAKWHEFLKRKYGNEEALVRAWLGLKPGESLDAGTIYLAPLRGECEPAALNDANPRAAATFKGEPVKYGRDDFNMRRGSDVNEFFAELLLGHKRRVAAAWKKGGRSAELCILLWDTGIGYNGICQLLHQNADAVSHCAYIGGATPDEKHHRYPWYSGLEEPPRICQNVPWLEHNTVEGKPYVVYETQIGSPCKYRVEFPYRIVFLAALQGWDAVCWHTMSGGYRWDLPDVDNPLVGRLSQPGHAAAQFTYKHDATQLSAMHAAGKMFTNLHLKRAKNPTKFIYGRRTLFHPDNMDYAGSYGRNGWDMLHTAYRYGSRIFIDLEREDDEIIGPVVRLKNFAHPNPIAPTDEMTYDWSRGYLAFDSPGAAAFVGFLSGYGSDEVEFKNGVKFHDFEIKSDPGMTYPVTEKEGYVGVALVSTDRGPLAGCRSAMISAVSTSHNTGLRIGRNPEVVRPRHSWDGITVFDKGELPVLHSRVGCTVESIHIAGMKYRMRDWHWNVIEEGRVDRRGRLAVPADRPVFLVELER